MELVHHRAHGREVGFADRLRVRVLTVRVQHLEQRHALRPAQALAGVGDAFVYPRTRIDGLGTWLLGTPGCIVIAPLWAAPADDTLRAERRRNARGGPPPGLTRVPSEGLCDLVRGYLDGSLTRDGVEVSEPARVELFPATLDPDNVDIQPAAVVPVTVRVRLPAERGARLLARDGDHRAQTRPRPLGRLHELERVAQREEVQARGNRGQHDQVGDHHGRALHVAAPGAVDHRDVVGGGQVRHLRVRLRPERHRGDGGDARAERRGDVGPGAPAALRVTVARFIDFGCTPDNAARLLRARTTTHDRRAA